MVCKGLDLFQFLLFCMFIYFEFYHVSVYLYLHVYEPSRDLTPIRSTARDAIELGFDFSPFNRRFLQILARRVRICESFLSVASWSPRNQFETVKCEFSNF